MAGIPGQGFFGLVALGPEDPFKEKLYSTLNLSKFSEEEITKAFKSIDKDGNGYINTDEVRYMLTTLYGMREPPEEDVKRFMKRFDANKDGKISFEEFQKAIPEVQKEVKEELKKNSAASTNSHSSLHRLRRKHVRLNAGPTKKFGTPMTTSQEIGWQQRSTAEKNKNDPQKPKNSCEETVFASDMIKSGIYY